MQIAATSKAGEPHGTSAILLEGGRIIDLARSTIRDADILIANGVIAQIAPHGTIAAPTAQRLDARECLILPGLTNSHTHSPENLAAGFCDGLRLDDWLKAIWSRLDHLSPEHIKLAVYLGSAQMLKCGVTAVVDHFRQTPMTLAALDSARAAYEGTGMRAIIAVMLRDRVDNGGHLVGAPTGGRPVSIAEARELWTEIAAWRDPRSRVAMGLGPSGPTRCSDAMLELAVEISDGDPSLCLHTHVAETQSCAATAMQLYGCRTIRHLNDLGFLGPRTSLAHCVWIDDEEIALIARSGAVVVHNPVSNMALGAGIAPVRAMIDAGAHVALGTDGAASNGAQDIFESIKWAALLPRCTTGMPAAWLTARAALTLAIEGGRRIFALSPSAVVEGAIADIAVFPTTDDTLDEFSDPVRELTYGAQPRARHVLVAGDPVVANGEIKSFDERALRAELRRA